MQGALDEGQLSYQQLLTVTSDQRRQALLSSDLAVIDLLQGNQAAACQGWRRALTLDPDCRLAQEHLQTLDEQRGDVANHIRGGERTGRRTRVAILSLLFNWPSTGGGTIHTAETGKFLQQAGYEVCHFYAQYLEWGLGEVTHPTLSPSQAISFVAEEWSAATIQSRFREAVDEFEPDFVIITDSWIFKPLLADAMHGYRYFLRLAAQECLCPLNNVRLLPVGQNQAGSCPRHQLATPDHCHRCLTQNWRCSGSLHQAERDLAGYGTPQYDMSLRRAMAEAEAVLVVNPLIAAMVEPYAARTCVVPSGFDIQRFPQPVRQRALTRTEDSRVRLLFAGLTQEWMKGFQILRSACERLWSRRRDFELVITGDPDSTTQEYESFIGWQSQNQLPHVMRQCDILVFPTLAEEALGRSAVEAMGAGIPVIASRIGGLQFTVLDGSTGLLFEPGNVGELAQQIERLLNDPELRQRMGDAGRERFEQHYTWDVILKRFYLPLLGAPISCER